VASGAQLNLGLAAILIVVAGLQRMLPRDVFGRAYGLAVPVSIGVIGVGSLLAPVLDSILGLTGTLLACAAAVLAYTAFLALPTRHPAPAAQLRSPAGDHGPESALAALPVSRPADSAPVATSRRALCAAGHSMPIQPGSGLGATTPNLPPSHDQDRRQNNSEHVTEYLGMSGAAHPRPHRRHRGSGTGRPDRPGTAP
jgi:hypothetical protein